MPCRSFQGTRYPECGLEARAGHSRGTEPRMGSCCPGPTAALLTRRLTDAMQRAWKLIQEAGAHTVAQMCSKCPRTQHRLRTPARERGEPDSPRLSCPYSGHDRPDRPCDLFIPHLLLLGWFLLGLAWFQMSWPWDAPSPSSMLVLVLVHVQGPDICGMSGMSGYCVNPDAAQNIYEHKFF